MRASARGCGIHETSSRNWRQLIGRLIAIPYRQVLARQVACFLPRHFKVLLDVTIGNGYLQFSRQSRFCSIIAYNSFPRLLVKREGTEFDRRRKLITGNWKPDSNFRPFSQSSIKKSWSLQQGKTLANELYDAELMENNCKVESITRGRSDGLLFYFYSANQTVQIIG